MVLSIDLASYRRKRSLPVTVIGLACSFQTKVGGTSQSGGSFEEVLSSTAHASAQSSSVGARLPETEEELQC